MGLNSRLKSLEGRNPEESPQAREEAISRETLARVTDEDLNILVSYLERRLEEGEEPTEEPTEEEALAVLRYERLRVEVTRQLDLGPS